MTAGQLMTRAVQVAHPETTVDQAMQMMTAGRFRHLPVIDHDTLIGLISIGDVVKARIMHQDTVVESLTAYVAGPPEARKYGRRTGAGRCGRTRRCARSRLPAAERVRRRPPSGCRTACRCERAGRGQRSAWNGSVPVIRAATAVQSEAVSGSARCG